MELLLQFLLLWEDILLLFSVVIMELRFTIISFYFHFIFIKSYILSQIDWKVNITYLKVWFLSNILNSQTNLILVLKLDQSLKKWMIFNNSILFLSFFIFLYIIYLYYLFILIIHLILFQIIRVLTRIRICRVNTPWELLDSISSLSFTLVSSILFLLLFSINLFRITIIHLLL